MTTDTSTPASPEPKPRTRRPTRLMMAGGPGYFGGNRRRWLYLFS